MSQGEIKDRFDVEFYKNGVNDIPSHFNILKDEILEFGSGKNLEQVEQKTEYKFIRAQNVKPYYVGGKCSYVNDLGGLTPLKRDDILIVRVGAGVCDTAIVGKDFEGSYYSDNVLRVKFSNKILPKFFAIYSTTDIGKSLFVKQSKGSGKPLISKASLENLYFPFLSIKKQEEIIDKMDSALIEKKKMDLESEKILESIDDYVLSELGIKLPVQKEEKNYFIVNLEDIKCGRIDVFYNKLEFKEIEKQFENFSNVTELRDVIDYIKTGTTPNTKKEPFSSEGIPFLRNTNLQKNGIITDELKYIKDEYKNTLTYSEKDDILICIAGTIGVSSVNDFGKIAINQNVSSLKIKQGISPYFISYLLNTAIFSEFFDRVSSVATIKYINNDNLLSIKIPLPSIEIQDKIANEVKSRIEKAKQLKNQATEIYEQAKDEVEKMILGK